MPSATPIQANFNGGEISPRMLGRVDQALYAVAAREMVNFVPTIEGPIAKRPGFRFRKAAMASASWLSNFIFNVSQAYVIEWGDLKLRFYTNDGQLETFPGSGVAYEVVVPYTAAEAPAVSTQQSYDRLHMAHPAHKQAALVRTGASTFSYAPVTLKDGPFQDTNFDKTKTMTASGSFDVGGTATITANFDAFDAGHVGAPLLLEVVSMKDIPAWVPQTGGVDPLDYRRSDGKVYKPFNPNDKKTGTVQPTHTEGIEWDGSGEGTDINGNAADAIRWEYIHDRYGIGTIATVTSPTQCTVTVTRRMPIPIQDGTYRWSMPAISAATGYPKIVVLAFNRLIYFTDFDLIASVAGDYGGGVVNMSPFSKDGLTTPDQAFRRRLSLANPILWAKVDRNVILVGTADGTHAIQKVNASLGFSSDNIEVVPQARIGSEPVEPVQADIHTVFIQRGGRKLREASYAFNNDRYIAPTMNLWQRHILRSGARQLAYQASPDELLWAVRNDGTLALHPHSPEQEVRGFARCSHAAGPVLSVTAVPSTDGTRDELWALVDGAGGKSVEQQAAAWEEEETDLEDAFFVDSGVSYSGAPIATLSSGLDHLVGQTVRILADGAALPPQEVKASSPRLTLPRPASTIHVGLGYTARLTLLRPEIRDAEGRTSQGKRGRLVAIALRLLDTIGIRFAADGGNGEELIERSKSDPMGSAPTPFTGDTVRRPIGGPFTRDPTGVIIHDEPTPCLVLAAMPEVEVNA